ncbi:unnamed protein product [Paramecium primaurelia]|uniref:Transmembrane protein n=1 Tax=Paramecium primaurelia TaxID=5886 RepID=A0A8S1K0X1_PARPR|nr:unnamed protein product [Paramecium primaurelia]
MSLKQLLSIKTSLKLSKLKRLKIQYENNIISFHNQIIKIQEISKLKRLYINNRNQDNSYNIYLKLFYFFNSLFDVVSLKTIEDIAFFKRYQCQLFNAIEIQSQRQLRVFKEELDYLYYFLNTVNNDYPKMVVQQLIYLLFNLNQQITTNSILDYLVIIQVFGKDNLILLRKFQNNQNIFCVRHFLINKQMRSCNQNKEYINEFSTFIPLAIVKMRSLQQIRQIAQSYLTFVMIIQILMQFYISPKQIFKKKIIHKQHQVQLDNI